MGQVRRGKLDEDAWKPLECLLLRPCPSNCTMVEIVPTNSIADGINDKAMVELTRRNPSLERVTFASTCSRGGVAAANTCKTVPQEISLCVGAVIVLTRSVRMGNEEEKWPN